MKTPKWALETIEHVEKKNKTHLELSGFGHRQLLKEIPKEVFELNELTQLILTGNHIKSIPEDIMKLDKLVWLDLTYNQISSLPSTFARLHNLQGLLLTNNQLTSFPIAITKLQNLTLLDLDNNKITEIPKTLSRLTNLRSMSLNHNFIETLPDEISQLPSLTEIHLVGNLLVTPPLEVANKGLVAIRQYFRQLRQGADFLYEAKLLIVGEGGAGKTTLARKIQNSSYRLQDESTTRGIEVWEWSFPIEEGRQFRVNIWDFGGQEIYHTTHQFFLTKRSMYALVADTRKEDTDFYYWLSVVELLSENSPLIIIKNEKQDRHREINERQLRGQFENLKEVLATNLATNRGLEKIIAEIQHQIKNLPHIGSALPKNWVRVREKLENDPRNYISLDEYLDVCQKNGFAKTQDSLQLSGYLHDIGVFLHFQDDDFLNKTVILR